MITGASSGILRSIMVTPDNLADIIPVDVAINLVGWIVFQLISFCLPKYTQLQWGAQKADMFGIWIVQLCLDV